MTRSGGFGRDTIMFEVEATPVFASLYWQQIRYLVGGNNTNDNSKWEINGYLAPVYLYPK